MEEDISLIVSTSNVKVEKRCTRCRSIKPVSEFYKSRQWNDGFHVYCKQCVLAYQKEKREQNRATSTASFRWKRDLIRHDYFAQIDTPIKAYILGVLAADGNILARFHRITLELSTKDADLLALVRDELVPGGAITARTRRGYDYQILAFVSHTMVKDLALLGITPAKSCTLQWPERLPPQFAREFILGYFDGDGFITYDKRPNGQYPYIGMVSGSPDLLIHIADIIEQKTGARIGGPWSKKVSKAYTIRASGKKALIIDKWLHADEMGLKRKRLA